MNEAFEILRTRNTGRCKLAGKSFGEAMHHFIVGGDEAGAQASDSKVMVHGDKTRKKQETAAHDSRKGVSIYRTGTSAGDTGPTSILLKGTKKPDHCTAAFLIKHGAAPGSDIHMTENACMTDAAWNAMSESHCKGMHAMPCTKANPHWWVLEIFDGCGSHVNNLHALEVRERHKIVAVKEEGDSSHVNQAYDKHVARSDKSFFREFLALFRTAKNIIKEFSRSGILSTLFSQQFGRRNLRVGPHRLTRAT
jgi:hypothetical protein